MSTQLSISYCATRAVHSRGIMIMIWVLVPAVRSDKCQPVSFWNLPLDSLGYVFVD